MEQKRKISAYTSNEKETMKRFNIFEAQINEELSEYESITKIEYYNGINLKDGIGRTLKLEGNIYIAYKTLEDGTVRYRFIYW